VLELGDKVAKIVVFHLGMASDATGAVADLSKPVAPPMPASGATEWVVRALNRRFVRDKQ
jgi:hypothetical protein